MIVLAFFFNHIHRKQLLYLWIFLVHFQLPAPSEDISDPSSQVATAADMKDEDADAGSSSREDATEESLEQLLNENEEIPSQAQQEEFPLELFGKGQQQQQGDYIDNWLLTTD